MSERKDPILLAAFKEMQDTEKVARYIAEHVNGDKWLLDYTADRRQNWLRCARDIINVMRNREG